MEFYKTTRAIVDPIMITSGLACDENSAPKILLYLQMHSDNFDASIDFGESTLIALDGGCARFARPRVLTLFAEGIEETKALIQAMRIAADSLEARLQENQISCIYRPPSYEEDNGSFAIEFEDAETEWFALSDLTGSIVPKEAL